jgi:hypothetical protein
MLPSGGIPSCANDFGNAASRMDACSGYLSKRLALKTYAGTIRMLKSTACGECVSAPIEM